MLNDADIPNIVTILPPNGGAVRSGNQVTINTSTVHNLQQGSVVQVGSVTDSSFNGSQKVTAVPTANSFTYAQSGPNTASGNGVVSVLVQGDWAMDAVLLPFANKAYRKVQSLLRRAGSKTTTNDVVLTPSMPIGMQILSDTSNPQLPADFLAPREVYERIVGTIQFGRMGSVNALPNLAQQTLNGCYSWFEDSINFIGATGQVDIRLRYFSGFPSLSDGTSQIQIRGGEDAVASYTAFLAANSRQPETSQAFLQQFGEDMEELLNMQVHARQYKPGRRRPNNCRSGWNGYGGTV